MAADTLRPRLAALGLLRAVLRRKRPLDEALEEPGTPFAALDDVRDRAFARNLVSTTLRRLGQADALIAQYLTRPLPRKAAPLRDILRLGTVQLLFLDTAPHAAVDTAVRLALEEGHHPYKNLVNAVLRSLSREGAEMAATQDAGRLCTPDWLWESWERAYGAETARRVAEAHLVEPPLDFSVKAEPETWAGRLEASILPTGTLRRSGSGSVTALPGFSEGAWWVQDAAAALPVLLLGDVSGQHVIDLCAAPGGKTAQLATRGARVTALDRSRNRLNRLQQNLDRLDLSVETVVADAALWRPKALADAVLLDAPCSSTGTLRRHPDVARLKTPKDVARLSQAQERLLDAALAMVRPGGLVVYCTCSLQSEEGPDRIASLLAGGAPAERVPIGGVELADQAEFVNEQGDLRTLPCHWAGAGGLDGFYASRLKRL